MHLAAYYSAAITNAAGTYTVPAVNDGWLNQQDGAFICPAGLSVLRPYVQATVLNRAFLATDKWRSSSNLDIVNSSTATSNFQSFAPSFPIDALRNVPPNESLYLKYVRGTLGASLVLGTVLFRVGQKRTRITQIANIQYTATVTTVAGAWSKADLVLSEPLPAGRWDVVGADVFSTAGNAFRLRFQNQLHCPGNWIRTARNTVIDYKYQYGYEGVWGNFSREAPPTVEVISSAAATLSLEVNLQLAVN